MASYTRRQLALMLLFVVLAGAGLGIGRWRQTHADLVEAFETFDQSPAETRSSTEPVSRSRAPTRASPARSRSSTPSQGASDRKAGEPAEPVDVNRATAADLRRLPGIGPVLATRIVEARDSGGPFTSIDDLRRVSGIGKSKLERLRSLVVVSQ